MVLREGEGDRVAVEHALLVAVSGLLPVAVKDGTADRVPVMVPLGQSVGEDEAHSVEDAVAMGEKVRRGVPEAETLSLCVAEVLCEAEFEVVAQAVVEEDAHKEGDGDEEGQPLLETLGVEDGDGTGELEEHCEGVPVVQPLSEGEELALLLCVVQLEAEPEKVVIPEREGLAVLKKEELMQVVPVAEAQPDAVAEIEGH